MRAAVERIQAERKDWQGVGLMAIEHLESGACGVVLVPSDVPAPDWSRQLLERAPGWEQHEDVSLVSWLKRWHADLSSRPDERWTEWTNLLRRHCPATLVASLPPASRQLAARRGFDVHALPPAAGDDLLGRLVAWALPWTVLNLETAERACCHWIGPAGLTRLWTREASMGAAGLTHQERVGAGGLYQWGILAAWPSAIDVLVAFLLAQADAMEACTDDPVAASKPMRGARKLRPLSKDRRSVVLVAVHQCFVRGSAKPERERPGRAAQRAAFDWALKNQGIDTMPFLKTLSADWIPPWYLDALRSEFGESAPVSCLLMNERNGEAFEGKVRKGLDKDQRREPARSVPVSEMEHGGTRT